MPEDSYFSQEPTAEDAGNDIQTRKFLIFKILDVEYGIDVRHVTDIVLMQRITPLPRMPEYIKGLMNLRGKIIPLMDVRLRFELDAKDYDDKTSIIVLSYNEEVIGLIVDTVCEVIDLPKSSVLPPPQISKGAGNRFIQGLGDVGERLMILLDVGRLLHD